MKTMVGWVEQTMRRQRLVRWLQVGHVPMVVGKGEVVVVIRCVVARRDWWECG